MYRTFDQSRFIKMYTVLRKLNSKQCNVLPLLQLSGKTHFRRKIFQRTLHVKIYLNPRSSSKYNKQKQTSHPLLQLELQNLSAELNVNLLLSMYFFSFSSVKTPDKKSQLLQCKDRLDSLLTMIDFGSRHTKSQVYQNMQLGIKYLRWGPNHKNINIINNFKLLNNLNCILKFLIK